MIQDPLALTSVIVAATAAAFWLDYRFASLGKVGASLIAIVLGAVLSNTGLVPAASPVYDVISGPVTSLAIVWLLLSVNLSDLKRVGPAMLKGYGLAVVGTVVGAFVGGLLFAGVFGADTWRLSGVLTGSFTGGSLNFVAVGRAVELPERLFAGATAADALVTGIWMGATLMLPVWLKRFFPPTPESVMGEHADEVAEGQTTLEHQHPFFLKEAISTLDLAVLMAVGVALLMGSSFMATLVPGIPAILWLTTLALAAGQLRGMARPMGAFPLGTLGLHFFFVVIGIYSRVSEIMAVGFEVFWLVSLVVVIHGVVVYGGGRLLRMDLATLSVASQAAVGGPSSALAVAVSREWKALVLPGIIVGLLGYAVGNYLGVAMAYLIRGLGLGG